MTALAIKLWLKKAWAWLKSVPTWVWAVLGWAVAFLAWQAAKRESVKAEVQQDRVKNFQKKAEKIQAVREVFREKVADAEVEHRVKKAEIEKKRAALEKTEGDTQSVTDALNDAFGGDDKK